LSNQYWEGSRQASLEGSQISAAWGRPGVEHGGSAISLANRAFEVYYSAYRNIAASAGATHYSQMLAALQDAARAGWGSGVSDLEESFDHLTSNGGRWTDNNTKNYYGGPNKIFQRTLVTGPEGPVNFLNAVDSKIEVLRGVYTQYNSQVQQLTTAVAADNWTQIGETLGDIKTWGERAKPFLWWAPAYEQRAGQLVGLADVLGNIHTAATMYTNSRAAGFDPRSAAALTALRTAVGFVPVLGDFYGRAVEMIPGLAAWFRGLIQERVRRIDAAAAEALLITASGGLNPPHR